MLYNNQSKQNSQVLTPEESMATLAFHTNAMTQMLPKASQTQETAPTGEQPQQVEEDKVSELEAKFSEFQKEIKTMIKDEIGGLKEELKNALSEETDESTTED